MSNWEGIPGKWIEDATAIDGWRFVASPHGVKKLRVRMAEQAKTCCEICNQWCYNGDRHHVYGRGAGGGKKEDRPTVNGVRFVIWIDRKCHEAAVIKTWGSWRSLPVLAPQAESTVP